MAKKILINAAFPGEIRVAIIQDDDLVDFDIQSQEHFRTKSNIYKGVVTRLEPGLEAVFVNYGEERNGFLPLKEIIPEYLNHPPPDGWGRDLEQLIGTGQDLIVQVDKEARKDKGAALTTRISMAGRFMVLMRNAPRRFNISKKAYGPDRARIQAICEQLEIPEDFGIIIRTAGVGRSKEDLRWDLNYLTHLWGKIEEQAETGPPPFLILQESDVITRTLRDNLGDDAVQIVVDTESAYNAALAIISRAMPNVTNKLELYDESVPLFTHYDIEKRIQTAFQHIIRLPSGGQLVFDRTEAMFIIDVNSSRSNKGADIEDTALTNNLEAVPEIARQMKMRDIGGLIVVDFIDMMDHKNKKRIEDAFHNEIQKDKARVRMSRISRFGMMELSRQRLRSSLDEFYLHKCPRCNGVGTIRTDAALAIQLHRHIWDNIQNPLTARIIAQVPEEVYKIIYANTEEYSLEGLPQEQKDKITLTADPNLHSPRFTITTTDQNNRATVINSFEGIRSESSSYSQPKHARKRKPLLKSSDVFQKLKPRRASMAEKLGSFLNNLFGSSEPSRQARPRRRKPRQRYVRKNRRSDNQHKRRNFQSRGRNYIKR